MKVLAIVGTKRKNGTTSQLCRSVLKGAEEKGHEGELINLYDYRIDYCKGCWACAQINSCPINDDFKTLFKKVKEADVIVLGSPCYWGSVTAIMKAFFDRHTGYAMYKPPGAHQYHSMRFGEKIRVLRSAVKDFGPHQDLAGKKFIFAISMTDPLPLGYLSGDLPQTLNIMKTYMKNLKGRSLGKVIYSDTLFRFFKNKDRRLYKKAIRIGRKI